MPDEFLLPDLGEGLTEAEIVSWLVAPGDIIVVDQLVVEVESAKSIVELPSPYGGRVEKLHAQPGQVVERGAPLITVVPEHEPATAEAAPDGVATDGVATDELVPGTALRAPAEAEPAGSGAVLVGYGTKESTMRLRRPEGGRFGKGSESSAATPAPADTRLLDPARRSPVVSPIVRKRARDHGFDASQLLGSGRDSLVVREDVEAAIAVLADPDHDVKSALVSLPASSPSADPMLTVGVTDLRIPITGLRKVVASRMTQSRRTIPEATVWLDVDATELLRTKDRLQKTTGERFSLTALIARFVVSGLKQYPILNSSVDDATNEIVQHGSINLGLAAQTPRGLMVPVVHRAHDLTTRQLRDGIAALVETSAKGDFPPSALSGGTFTLNNYGGFGVDGSAAIINYPEVAMLGVGRVVDRPWVVDGELAVRKVVVLTLVFDHRVCDGDVASGFLTYVARCVEEPLLLLSNV